MGGLFTKGGLVGSLALYWDLGKVLNTFEVMLDLGGGEGEIFPGLLADAPLSKALIRSAMGTEPTADRLDIFTST